VTNAPKNMLFNQIGRHTPKPVAPESIDVTVAPSSPGINNNPKLPLFLILNVWCS